MSRLLLPLLISAGLAYGGLYVYYGMALENALDDRIGELGMTDLDLQGIDYSLLAPLQTRATVTADVRYHGAEASMSVRVDGHPLFTEDMRLSLDGLQSLRLRMGPE